MTATSELSLSVLERVKEAWRPRFLANGVQPYDYEVTTKRIARWEDWLPEWRRTAEEHVAAAQEAERAGHDLTAAHYKRLAAMCLHFGHFNVVEPESEWLAAQRQKAELFRDVLAHLDPPAERVEIPFAGVAMPAHVRRPRGATRPPVVVYFSGLDSTKEEATTFEDVLLARGLATVTFDGPGQGETWERMPGRVDWEKAATAVVDFVAGRRDLDASRIVAVGVSLGGYLVMRSAAFERRIRAAAGIGGRFDQSDRDLDDPMHGPRFLHFWGVRTVAEGRPLMNASTLDGIIEKMDRPILVVHGARDTLATPENARRIVDRTGGPATWVLYPEGNHVCNNIPHKYRPLVADWLAGQVGLAT
jgi:2,6-dihydroxypseudooxynicotine hydrolase